MKVPIPSEQVIKLIDGAEDKGGLVEAMSPFFIRCYKWNFYEPRAGPVNY